MDRSAIQRSIETAFSGVTRDPDQSLHQAQLTDQGIFRQIHPKEWRDAGLRDVETDWSAVPSESIDECDAALSHSTPVSWRFYLPAYICRAMSLFAAPRYETDVLSSAIFHLTYRNPPSDYLRERYEMLSSSQAAAVRDFLEFIEHESLLLIEATNEYWHTYDDAKAVPLTLDIDHWNRVNEAIESIVMPMGLGYDVEWRLNAPRDDDDGAKAA